MGILLDTLKQADLLLASFTLDSGASPVLRGSAINLRNAIRNIGRQDAHPKAIASDERLAVEAAERAGDFNDQCEVVALEYAQLLERRAAAWKEIAERLYADKVYPDQRELADGAMDALFRKDYGMQPGRAPAKAGGAA